MFETLDELMAHLQNTIPQWKTATHLKRDESGKYVTFRWNGRDLLVKRSLEVFEMKNQQLFVTGASVLMQSALATKSRHQMVLENALQALYQAQDLIEGKTQVESGLKLLATVKHTIAKLAKQ